MFAFAAIDIVFDVVVLVSVTVCFFVVATRLLLVHLVVVLLEVVFIVIVIVLVLEAFHLHQFVGAVIFIIWIVSYLFIRVVVIVVVSVVGTSLVLFSASISILA